MKVLNVKNLLQTEKTRFDKFYQHTKLKKELPYLDPKMWPPEWKNVYFKGYARMKEIKLPKPRLPTSISYKKLLQTKKSTRIFSKKVVKLDQLSNLLYYSAGLKQLKPPWIGNRFYPSAGARYPIETYIISLNSQLQKGIYHYYLKSHSLEMLDSVPGIQFSDFVNQPQFQNVAIVILLTAVYARSTIKYGDRGYRYIFMEIGHLSQNFYLTAGANNLGICSVGGFNDDKLNSILDLDSLNESVLLSLAIGNV